MRAIPALALFVLTAFALEGWHGQALAAQPRAKNEELARARALDKEGAKAYGEGRFADAIRYFEESHRLGGPPFELWNVAKCYLRLDQAEQAAQYLERYLATPNLPKEDREEATQQLEGLKKRPSTIAIASSPPGAQVAIDGKPIEGVTPTAVTVPAGKHTIVVSSTGTTPYTQQIEARYGRALSVDAPLTAGEGRPAPPANPYDRVDGPTLIVRGALNVVLPRHGSIGGSPGPGFMALGAYRVASLGSGTLGLGGLFSISGDHWSNHTGGTNDIPGVAGVCSLPDEQSATAFSLFALGHASFPVTDKLRLAGLAGLGLAAYAADGLGSDLFVPSCTASPGVRPAVLFGAEVDYAITRILRLSAFPLTWQLQPAFDGTRGIPRDASGIWMRFGFGVGLGVDL